MYSTCLYCSRDLGSNEIVETLPVGRRLAFDESTGRLWVVCRSCEKWNLVPFDNRLETIDACERLFRDAKLKFSTDNIGIARLSEGLELVRIGRAERHEFAAWRYGDQFGRRRIKSWLVTGALLGSGAAALVFRHQVGMVPIIGSFLPSSGNHLYQLYTRRRAMPRVGGPGGGVTTPHQLIRSQFSFDENGRLALHLNVYDRASAGIAIGVTTRRVDIRGEDVVPALGLLLPRLNGSTSKQALRDAVDMMTPDIEPETLVGHVASSRWWTHRPHGALARPATAQTSWARRWFPEFFTREYELGPPQRAEAFEYRLMNVPDSARLALEMLAHEQTERVALAGQLKWLERQWKEADKLAKIADELALPEDVGA